jgi:hypothetical protein
MRAGSTSTPASASLLPAAVGRSTVVSDVTLLAAGSSQRPMRTARGHRQRRRTIIALTAIAVLAGCADRSIATAPPQTAVPSIGSPPASPSPTPDRTAVAYLPAPPVEQIAELPTIDALVLSAVRTVGGTRLTLEVDANEVVAGTEVRVRSILENIGRTAIHWDPWAFCSPVSVWAQLPYRWEYGANQPNPYLVLKQWLLGHPLTAQPQPIRLVVDGARTEEVENACEGRSLPPGGRVEHRHVVETQTTFSSVYFPDPVEESWSVPAGPAMIVASFGSWVRGEEDPDDEQRPSIEVVVPIQITGGRNPRLLAPGQVIDVALGSPELRELIRARPRVDMYASTMLSLDEGTGRWTLRLTYDEARVTYGLTVVVDGIGGTILLVESTPSPS